MAQKQTSDEDWTPESSTPVSSDEDWTPESSRVPVKAYSRKPRKRGLGSAIGGFVGGQVGTPGGPAGRIGGAGVGGAIGEAVEQGGPMLFGPSPALALPSMDPKLIAQAGAEQAAAEAVGGLLAKGATALARPVMRAAIQPIKAIRMGFKDVAKTALETGTLMIRPMGKIVGGVATSRAARIASSAAEDALLDEARLAGNVWNAQGIAQPALDSAQKFLGRPLNAREYANVVGQVKEVLNEAFRVNSRGAVTKAPDILGPAEMKVIKQFSQNMTQKFKQAISGTVEAGKPDTYATVAASTKQLLEGIVSPSASGRPIGEALAEQFSKTQDLIGLQRAVKGRMLGGEDIPSALSRYGARGTAAAIGAGAGAAGGGSPAERATRMAGGAALGLGLTSPLVLSTMAHLLNNPAVLAILRQTPRAGTAVANQ